MAKATILVVEDEDDIRELISYNLRKEGYGVVCARTGEEALASVKNTKPDVILLDLMLPGIDGLDVCRELKTTPETQHISIIIVSAKDEDPDVVTGLELGADDYITKPFSVRVLIARLKVVLRGKKVQAVDALKAVTTSNLVINPSRHEVLCRGEPVALTATEFKLLHFLAHRPGLVFTRNHIIKALKGDDYPVTERSVDVQISGLRTKLSRAGHIIETIRGVGYRFND